MATYLVTGTSRGLGFALITHLNSLPSSEVGVIFALARSETPALKTLIERAAGRVVLVKADTTDESSLQKVAGDVESRLRGKGLDVLVNNVGIMTNVPNGIASMDDLASHFNVNVLGTHAVTRTFIPLLEKGTQKKIVNITTTLGSLGLAGSYSFSPSPAYKITKAALNMLTIQYALDYAEKGFTIFALSPGVSKLTYSYYVPFTALPLLVIDQKDQTRAFSSTFPDSKSPWLKTDLGGGDMADLPAETGAKAALDKIFAATKENNGQFLNILVEGYENVPGPNKYDGKNPIW
ncbi:related to short chain oxidoreductase (CsgA) [Rhynchosporium agropyri]|uniref:Related to short chain oxidoreductase (CsgA) n=1 Tax=Rhynchosporium agropyri TaxID=914238 RepID=A0A1E1L4T6_9HELO|nr:related to short chain oxidoreductase (CsgA) [Rhynchosporium agropyri]